MKIKFGIVMTSVHQEPFPSFVFEEIARVALDAILDTEFHVVFVGYPDHCKDCRDDAVLAVLGIFPAFNERDTSSEKVKIR